ncbi:MAG: hypothetical protein DRI46_11220 [Chloroflexi bacterium]|nr:MAG: hypothetical protein DRI46_11220 [Chloroflexota bacterium]
MTNNVLMMPGVTLPGFVKQSSSALADAMGGGLSQTMPSISLRNSRFHFKKDGNEIGTAETTYLDVVIVGASEYIHRAYYDKAYDQASDAKPACTSHRGINPDAGAPTKQHDSCQFCPMNTKQPDPRRPGKEYTPCGFSKDIAVMIPGDATKTVWRLKLSSMTLFNSSNDTAVMSWKGMLGKFNSIGADPLHYVVRLTFDTEASVPMLNFSVQATVGDGTSHYDEVFYNAVLEAVDNGDPAKVVGDEVVIAQPVGTVENQAPAPAQMPVAPAAPAAAAPPPTAVAPVQTEIPMAPAAPAIPTAPPVAVSPVPTAPPAQAETSVQEAAPVAEVMEGDASAVNALLNKFKTS